MKEDKIEKLLNELADATTEPAPSYLAEDVKHQIPQQLSPHRSGLDTINIIIDLRISKLTAAAAIILVMILFASFFGGQNQGGDGIFKSGKDVVYYEDGVDTQDGNTVLMQWKLSEKYFLGSVMGRRSNVEVAKSRYERLAQSGKDVVYYGDNVDPQDSNAVLIQWKLSDGNYKVVFGDLREETVSAEELIRLQAQMLQKKPK